MANRQPCVLLCAVPHTLSARAKGPATRPQTLVAPFISSPVFMSAIHETGIVQPQGSYEGEVSSMIFPDNS